MGNHLEAFDAMFAQHKWRRFSERGPIQVTPIDLTNPDHIQQASSPRKERDYRPRQISEPPVPWYPLPRTRFESAEPVRLPANVKRELFSQENVDRLLACADSLVPLGVTDFKFINVQHELWDGLYRTHLMTPVELAVSYSYLNPDGKEVNIAGSPVISALHRLSELKFVPPASRKAITKYHLENYLLFVDRNVSIIAIPPREEGSPTHQAFAALAVPHPETGAIVEHTRIGERPVDLYYFAHGESGATLKANTATAQELMFDTVHRQQILPAIDNTWATNFLSTMRNNPQPDPYAPHQVYMAASALEEDHWDRRYSILYNPPYPRPEWTAPPAERLY